MRKFLNGTWLREPLHVVLTDIPIGAWTAAMCFDAIDSVRSARGFALAADASITIGLLSASAATVTGLAEWSDLIRRLKNRFRVSSRRKNYFAPRARARDF